MFCKNIKFIRSHIKHMYSYIECRTHEIEDLLLILGNHIMTLIFLNIMTIFMESLGHSTCLQGPLTLSSCGCRIDINRMMFSSSL